MHGCQTPRLLHLPDGQPVQADDALNLLGEWGFGFDEWQRLVMTGALLERADGRWAAKEVGVEVSRQNGKGELLEARGLLGLFLLGERLLIHSAHEFATASEALERMDDRIAQNPLLKKRVRTVKRSHGEEGVYLKDGRRLRYKTRTKGGGRGFTADWLALDEAMFIPEAFHGALLPTISARPNPQIWYTGSAVDQETMEHGVVFARVRERAMEGADGSLAYFGWSPAFDRPHDVPLSAATDPDVWAQGNPALGIRISEEHVAMEQRAMDSRRFAVERLGVGDWPRVAGEDGSVISVRQWLSLVDPGSALSDGLVFVYDVSPDRSSAAIAAAGRRSDGLMHVEVVEHDRGTGWVVPWLKERAGRHQPVAVRYAQAGPAASLAGELEDAGVLVEPVSEREHAQACGGFFDAVDQRTVRHLGTSELVDALRGASTRPLGDAWAWARKRSTVDICPLVAVTLAHWAAGRVSDSVYEQRGVLVL